MKYIIYKKKKVPTQSGEKKTEYWVLELVIAKDVQVDILTGWKDTQSNLSFKLKFDNEKEAIDYAIKNRFDFEVIRNLKGSVQEKRYADNFKYKRIRTDI
ncbi:MAG: hypothetical protein CMP36_00165 [Rickettsiales bacterium]|nr:hypothetical protein [Rickettsiales bacterium]OUV83611.1 MAG: hypothetical protein CBC91_00400 [Rickettsiales bacterium TMED131]